MLAAGVMASAPLVLMGLLGQLVPCEGLGMALAQRRGDWFWRKPQPAALADACLTATEGDRCHKAVKYAVEKGHSRHPHWYPEYKHTGVTDLDMREMQMVLHKLKKAGCAKPCQFNETEVEQEIEAEAEANATGVELNITEEVETTTPLVPMVETNLEDLSLDDLSKYLKRPEELDAYVGKIGGWVAPAKKEGKSRAEQELEEDLKTDPNHPTDGGDGSTDGSRGKPPSGARDDPTNHPTDGGDGSTDGSKEKPPSRARDDPTNHPTDGGDGSTDGSKEKPPSTDASKDELHRQLAALGSQRRIAERLVQTQKDDYDQLLADRPAEWSPRSAAVESRLKKLSASRQQAERRMQQLEGRLEQLETASGMDPIEAAKIEAQR